MSMVRISIFLATLTAALLLAGCTPGAAPPPPPAPSPAPQAAPRPSPEETALSQLVAAAQKEGRVTLYTFFFTGDTGQAMAEAFERKYGVKADIVGGVGTVLMERIKAEARARQYIADSLDTSLVMMAAAKMDGLTQPWGALPVLAEKGMWLVDPKADQEGHLLIAHAGLYAPHVHTNLVKAGEEPRSYKDLVDPRWKGRIVVADERTAPMNVILLLSKVIDEDFLRRLGKQELKMVATVRDALGTLVRGEAAVWLPGADSLTNPMIVKGVPIKPVDMEEGVVAYKGTSRALIKNAPHPNAARLFQNWLLSREGQDLYHRIKGTLSVRQDVPDYRPAITQIKHRKLQWQTLEEAVEAARLQREGYVNKLLGLE